LLSTVNVNRAPSLECQLIPIETGGSCCRDAKDAPTLAEQAINTKMKHNRRTAMVRSPCGLVFFKEAHVAWVVSAPKMVKQERWTERPHHPSAVFAIPSLPRLPISGDSLLRSPSRLGSTICLASPKKGIARNGKKHNGCEAKREPRIRLSWIQLNTRLSEPRILVVDVIVDTRSKATNLVHQVSYKNASIDKEARSRSSPRRWKERGYFRELFYATRMV